MLSKGVLGSSKRGDGITIRTKKKWGRADAKLGYVCIHGFVSQKKLLEETKGVYAVLCDCLGVFCGMCVSRCACG
jgi:hypothetical protein